VRVDGRGGEGVVFSNLKSASEPTGLEGEIGDVESRSSPSIGMSGLSSEDSFLTGAKSPLSRKSSSPPATR
jgi:hypothetical protein